MQIYKNLQLYNHSFAGQFSIASICKNEASIFVSFDYSKAFSTLDSWNIFLSYNTISLGEFVVILIITLGARFPDIFIVL